MSQKLREFLKFIRYRSLDFYDPDAIEYAPMEPLSPDDWQRFKRDFVKEINGQQVRDTGMTHTEFLDYIDTGLRENDWRYNEDVDVEIYQGQGQWTVWNDQPKGID